MSSAYANAPLGRKGHLTLRRLGVRLRFESTIEERVLLLLDASPDVQDVQRAERIQIYLPDGTCFTYTPDFTVTLTDTQKFTLECKPYALLKTILDGEQARWVAKDSRLQALDAPLRFVTERDCPALWLEQVKTFSPFCRVEPNETVRERCVTILRERGSMPLAALRTYLRTVLPEDDGEVDSTVYGMLARCELFSQSDVTLTECRVALSGGGFVVPRPPLGMLFAETVSLMSHAEISQDPALSEPKWSREFEQSARGKKYRQLFIRYSDPTLPLPNEAAEEIAAEVGVSSRTVYRFREILLKAGAPGITFSEVMAYVAPVGRGKPRHQVDAEIQAIIEVLAKDMYFRLPGEAGRVGSVGAFFHEVEAACLKRELVPPTENTVRRYISLLEQRDPIEAARRRYGREHSQKLEARQGHLNVSRYGELIAIDCSPCDVFVQDDGELLLLNKKSSQGKGQREGKGKPYRATLVLVADVATSQVLRVATLPGAARAADILTVLRHVFLRQTKDFEQAGVTVIPQAMGLPAAIRMDGGSEFVNRQVERVLQELGIEVLPRNKFSKHWGGVEERTIQTFTHSQHGLPGTSMNSIEKRGEHDTQKKAVMSLAELDRFNQRILERHNSLVRTPSILTRQQHAQQLMDTGKSVWRPLSQAQRTYLLTRMHPQEERKCLPEGISLFGLFYNAPALRPLIVKRCMVEVAYNPDDISAAYVIHPETGERIRVEARLPQGLTAPLSLLEWDNLKREFHAAEETARRQTKTRGQIVTETLKEVEERRQQVKGRKPKIRSLKPPPIEVDASLSRIKAVELEFEDYPMEA